MNQLKVSTRLLWLVGTLIAMLVALGGLGLYGTSQSNAALKTVYEDRTIPATSLSDIQRRMLSNYFALTLATTNPSPDMIELHTGRIEANIATITKTWQAYTANRMTPEEAALARTYAERRAAFVGQGLKPAIEALRGANVTEARQIARDVIPALYAQTDDAMATLLKLQIDVAGAEYAASVTRYERLRLAALAAIVLGVAFAAVFGLWLTRSLMTALGAEPAEVKRVADAVAGGDLTTPFSLRAGDRTSVMAAMKTMCDQLARTVSSVRSNADSVATASAQIAQGNNDLSGRTEEQASALEQTAASMEELGSTVRQNADNARQANQLASGASSVAVRGGEVVGRVVETMKGIHDASQRIADIIGTIDGIAFQTNILALNAAVEAARAGEQGRGFAVVAGEVRSLAQRAADAAKEIKGLIAVSVERVEQGSTLVGEAGTTMNEVVLAIRRVADIMGEISSASVEQSAGVAQVGEAVTQMDQTTQQNAALVEESAAAAESLRAQATQLVQAMAVFKLAGAAVMPAPLASATALTAHGTAPRSTPAAPWVGQERRSPNRAKNVSRLTPKALASDTPAVLPTAATKAPTGTDDWETF